MPSNIFPNDLVFPVTGDNIYSDGSSVVSPSISLATSFASRARSVSDYRGFSVIADLTGADGAQGSLSVWTTNASFTTRGDGSVLFSGPVIWVQKTQSIIAIGGQDALPPFEIGVPFNYNHAMQLRYQAQSGIGTLRAQLGRVGA